MEQLEELQTLWQKQHLLIGEMARYQDRQLRISIVKTVVVAVALVPFFWILAKYARSALVVCGNLWIVASVAVFMVVYWRRQFRVSSLDFAAPPVDFVRAAAAGLERQHRLFGAPVLIFAASLLVGLNLTLLGLSASPVAHMIYSLEVPVICWGGLKIREWRFRRESQPLVERLAAAEEDLAGR